MVKNIAVIGDSESIKGFGAVGIDMFICDEPFESGNLLKRIGDIGETDTVYVSLFPCDRCMKTLIDKGIKNQRDDSDGFLNILFVGTLTWEPNNQGLIWFLDNVIPILDHDGIRYRLYIVGKNPSTDIIERTKGNSSITVTGYVDSVDVYYDLCDCTIVPLFIGSGQRVKLIEAFSKGMPAISTSIGAEGLEYIDGETIIIADDKDDFKIAIKTLTDKQRQKDIGEKAREIYDKNYSPEAIEELLCQAVLI